jgi:peptidoglycan hydrolase-like protein with peptidoglycan-binding domain
VAAVAVLALPAAASKYKNGHFPRSALAPIYIPHNTAYLAKRAARQWNTMRLCAIRDGLDLYPEASDTHPAQTAYRTYDQQVALYNQYGYPHAAHPGTSNHGLGRAVDVATMPMRTWIDEHGERFGWGKHGDAPDEWWHVTFDQTGKTGPDPGISAVYPELTYGSGGTCQAHFVKEVQRDLGVKVTGVFHAGTQRAVEQFQSDHGLPVGPVKKKTWKALRAEAGAPNPPQPAAPRAAAAAHHPLDGE